MLTLSSPVNSDAKWLDFKAFRVYPTILNFLTFGDSALRISWSPECPNVKKFKMLIFCHNLKNVRLKGLIAFILHTHKFKAL